jgi:IS1 family transposase/ribosomal protein L37E
MIVCAHIQCKKCGRDRYGNQRYQCSLCGKKWSDRPANPLGNMTTKTGDAKLALRLLVEGNSIRSTERITGLHRDTICKLLVHFGTACKVWLDKQMQGLKLTHLQFDEQWTYVYKKQSRLTVEERAACYDKGDMFLWTCIDQQTKLLPSFLIGKRSADNARRFMQDVAGRIDWPNPHASDRHAYQPAEYRHIVQISTDGFNAYPEAVDLAFGPYAKYGTIIKDYRNASMIYTPSEMVGTQRTARRGMRENERWTICTSHVERLNGTQRLFMKRLNRLTVCFSKKLENLEAAFSIFAAWYNYCWQTASRARAERSGPRLP